MALLALVGVLRCELDPAPVVYYFAPVVIALAVWEVGRLRRLPVVTVGLCAWLALVPTMRLEPETFAVVWLGGMLVLVIYLVRSVFRPADVPTSALLPGLQPFLDAQPSS